MRRKKDDNSATQRSIGHDIREFPRGRDDEKERDRGGEEDVKTKTRVTFRDYFHAPFYISLR